MFSMGTARNVGAHCVYVSSFLKLRDIWRSATHLSDNSARMNSKLPDHTDIIHTHSSG